MGFSPLVERINKVWHRTLELGKQRLAANIADAQKNDGANIAPANC